MRKNKKLFFIFNSYLCLKEFEFDIWYLLMEFQITKTHSTRNCKVNQKKKISTVFLYDEYLIIRTIFICNFLLLNLKKNWFYTNVWIWLYFCYKYCFGFQYFSHHFGIHSFNSKFFLKFILFRIHQSSLRQETHVNWFFEWLFVQ